jgi:hypothetical protein
MTEYTFGEFAPDAAKDNANVLTECLNMRYDAGGYMNIKADGGWDPLDFTSITGSFPSGGFINCVASTGVTGAINNVISVFYSGSSFNIYSANSSTPTLERTDGNYLEDSLINFGQTALYARISGKAYRRTFSTGVWSEITTMTYESRGLYCVRDFVFSIKPDLGQGCAIEWSDINEPQSWGGTGLSDQHVLFQLTRARMLAANLFTFFSAMPFAAAHSRGKQR